MRRDLNPSRVSSERAQALFAQAVTMHQRGSIGEAEQLYRLVLAADKKHPGALQYLAMLEGQRGNLTEARRLLEQWIRSNRRSAEAHTNLGYVLALMGLHQEALAAYDKALSIDPRFLTALNNRGISLREVRRFTDAVSNYDRALSVKPDFADALYNRGNVLNRMGRCAEALADFDRALSISPNDPDTWIGRATALRGLGRANEAVASLDKVLAWVPNNVLALANRGHILSDLRRYEEAIVSYGKALQIDPSHTDARSPMAWAAMAICDWDLSGHLEGELKSDIRDHKSIVQPFMLLAQCDDPALQLTCAQNFVADKVEPGTKLLWKRGDPIRNRGERIRIAYLSADFRQHAIAYLITRLLEKHDRSRFEVIGISIGKDDASVERKRIVDAVDAFIDVQRMSDHEIAQLIFKRQIDILVDLNGHAQGGRIGILAYRPAPVQVNYLGYPGTTGADFVDYVVADEIILPMNRQPFYSEQIIQLPDYYAAYDPLFENGLTGADRHDAGLPENGVVFCCFSNNYKITKLVFDVWMRLLQSVEGAVLWLLRDTSTAERNLRKEAVACSVDPSRLVFADRVSLSRHLARQRLADLFLDTSPYNAHTTACDALWMGLPLVTCAGRAFAGRVAASLLTAAGLPELVTTSLDEYEALGRKLATDSALLNSYRERLTRNRASFPPFDADRLRRQIEAAYARMWDIRCNTQSPQGITSGEPASR